MNFLVLPIFFLSGALYPLSNLPRVLTWITHGDPLAYGVDGLRGVLIGTWQFSFSMDMVTPRYPCGSFVRHRRLPVFEDRVVGHGQTT